MDDIKKGLTILLTLVSGVSLINVLVLYWLPINIPLSSFSIVRLAVVAFIEKRHYLILVSLLICTLQFLSIIFIRREQCILPILALLYQLYDFVAVLILFVSGFSDGYWSSYIIQLIISFSLLVLLSSYCWNCIRTGAGQGTVRDH